MAIVTSGKILVTGANGFVAMWVVDRLFKQGYAVRATVRSADKGVHLAKTFAAYGEKLEIVVVEDITAVRDFFLHYTYHKIRTHVSQGGAFDKAVEGVDAVMHLAAPVHFDVVEPAEMIDPTVKGTVGLLNSVIAHGHSVKRVVYTSSAVAVATLSAAPRTWDENDWNDAAVQACQENGRDAPAMFKYCASKVLAERAAWDVFEKHKAATGGSWELVTIVPPYILGPVLQAVSTPQTLNDSMRSWYDAVFGEMTESQLLLEGYVVNKSS